MKNIKTEKLAYFLSTLFGIIFLFVSIPLLVIGGSEGLTESEVMLVKIHAAGIGLGGFLMLIAGVSGLSNKQWAKKLALAGLGISILAWFIDGNLLYAILSIVIALLIFYRG